MGLFTAVATLPIAPIRGVIWLAEQLERQAEKELNDPTRIREQLRQAEVARDAGEITDRECAELQDLLLRQLAARRYRDAPG